MPVLGLIAASALAAAEWRSPPVSDGDYPTTALIKQKSAASMLEVLIGPDGKVVKCTQTAVLGDEQLAAEMCAIAKRKKANPARDAAGKPAFGFRREFASLMLPGTYQADQIGEIGPTPDVEIEVASIPAGSPNPVLVNLTIGVDKSGKTTACKYAQGNWAAAFGKVACDQVKAMEFDKVTDAGGAAVSYVRPISVRFSLASKTG